MRASIFNSQNKIGCIPSKERGRPLVIPKGDDSALDKYRKNDGDTSEGNQAEHSFPMKLSSGHPYDSKDGGLCHNKR